MSNKAGWYTAGHRVYMLHMLVSEWQGTRWCNYNTRSFISACTSQFTLRVKIAYAWVWNNLQAKHRVPFIYTMCAGPAVHYVGTPTMNLNYSPNSAQWRSWKLFRQQCFQIFLSYFLFAASTNQKSGCADVRPVPPCSVEPEELAFC